MRLIAEAMDALNREAVAEAARRSPGENIEIGLALGDFALAIAQHDAPRPEEVAPAQLWKELKRKRSQAASRESSG